MTGGEKVEELHEILHKYVHNHAGKGGILCWPMKHAIKVQRCCNYF